MSVSANIRLTFGAIETVAVDGAGNLSLAYTAFDRPSTTYNGSSTPAVSKVAVDSLVLSGGTDTINLTAVPGGIATQDLTGLKVVTLILYNPNANSIAIAPGASNPYPFWGTANDIVLPAGARMAFDFVGTLPAVSGTVKNIDVVGTAADILSYALTAG